MNAPAPALMARLIVVFYDLMPVGGKDIETWNNKHLIEKTEDSDTDSRKNRRDSALGDII